MLDGLRIFLRRAVSWVGEKLVAGSLSSRLKFPKIKQTATSGPAADKRAKPGGSRRAEFIRRSSLVRGDSGHYHLQRSGGG